MRPRSSEGQGVQGSASFGSYRQVTIIALERWLAMMAELGADVDPSARRADLMVSGLDLERSRDRLVNVGSCLLRIGGEVKPCERMDEAYRGLRDGHGSAMGRRRVGGGAARRRHRGRRRRVVAR